MEWQFHLPQLSLQPPDDALIQGKILELSAKVGSDAEASKYAELERLVKMKNLSLSASQDTKTSMVLETLADHTSPPRSFCVEQFGGSSIASNLVFRPSDSCHW